MKRICVCELCWVVFAGGQQIGRQNIWCLKVIHNYYILLGLEIRCEELNVIS